MKHLLITAVALSLSLAPSLAVAEPTDLPPFQKAEKADYAALEKKELSLTLRYRDVDVITLLQKISFEGNVDIIVGDDVSGTIKEINLVHVSPERALEEVTKLSGLEWKLENRTYIVSPKASEPPTGKKDVRINARFVDVPVSEVLKIIATQGDVQLSISEDVTEKLQLIRLTNETPQGAIEKLAAAAHLICRKDGDNHYTITSPKPSSATQTLPPSINPGY